MNILKLKSILCSLMAITMVTVFLSSCEKDGDKTNEQVEQNLSESSKILSAFGIYENPEVATEYFNNATPDQIESWKNIAEIADRLLSIGKLDEVISVLTFGQNISELDLSLILSKDDLDKFYNANPKPQLDIDMRGCTWKCVPPIFKYLVCCKPPNGDCHIKAIRFGC